MLQLAHGAEAVLYLEAESSGSSELGSTQRGSIIKERLSKAYRLPHLDESLRKFRTRREAKILQKLEELDFPAPHLREFSDKRMSIIMDMVPGEKLKDVLAGNGLAADDVHHKLAAEIGKNVAKLHQHDIIHGDLTTSNMIRHQDTGQLHFIDFGLSSFSGKVEDKAVDLYLLERALASTHYELGSEMFEKVIEGYRKIYPERAEEVLERLKEVRKRGRNKGKG